MNKKVDRFSPEALDLLSRYPWPGNLRELENVIERSVVLASTREVEQAHLPLYLQQEGPIRIATEEGFLEAKERAIQHFEREAVTRFLAEAKGNISLAAKQAKITRRNFHRLIAKYSINTRLYKSENSKTQ